MTLAEMAKPALPSSTLRSYAMIGIVLYAFGVVLNEIGNGLTQLWLVPYADTISALGFVIALYTASLAGVGTRLMVVIGLVYGIGTFFVSEPDATYAASGLRIGSYSTTHSIGLGLIGFTLIWLIGLAFYLTRVKSPHRALPKQDPGSTN
jgi:hypothetical protein